MIGELNKLEAAIQGYNDCLRGGYCLRGSRLKEGFKMERPGKYMSADAKALANRIRFPDKERDLCRAVGMASDLPVLLRRAIEAYDNKDLKPDSEILIMFVKSFLDEYEKLERQFAEVLKEMAEMSGLDICKIGYDD